MATTELLDEWKKFRLTSIEEEVTVDVDQGAIQKAGRRLETCLAGKLLLQMTISREEALKKVFQPLWKAGNGFAVEGIGRNMFLFRFDYEKECDRVFKMGPWSFDKA